jgi:hypothetical protein
MKRAWQAFRAEIKYRVELFWAAVDIAFEFAAMEWAAVIH